MRRPRRKPLLGLFCLGLFLTAAAGALASTLFVDRTFSRNGSTFAGFYRVCCAEPFDLATDGRGRIVAAGSTALRERRSDVAVVRLLEDGRRDRSFSSNGQATFDLTPGGTGFTAAFDLLPVGQGRVLLSGSAGDEGFLLRLNARGRRDRSFSGDGLVRLPGLSPSSLARGPRGGVYVAGASAGTTANWLMRLEDDGSTDEVFGDAGMATADFGSRRAWSPTIDVGKGGRIALLSGYKSGQRWLSRVARFEPDGDLDRTFAEDGMTPVGLISTTGYPGGVRIGRDGKVTVVIDAAFGTVGVARLTRSGSLDSDYGNGGEFTARYRRGSEFYLGGVAYLPNNGLVAGGSFGTEKLALLRLRPDGRPAGSFGERGWKVFRPKRWLYVPLMALRADGKAVFAGSDFTGPAPIRDGARSGFRFLRFLAR